MATVILSPHLDDAVLSCWHLLEESGEVAVVNVFAGVPERIRTPAWWDRLTGATDSRQRMRERIEEDRKALALAERTPVNLDFLDGQYRGVNEQAEPLTARIRAPLQDGAHIYAPAGIGDHPDHGLVRAAALELHRAGFTVSLYADLPHAIRHGWPAWVTGTAPPSSSEPAAALWDAALGGFGSALEALKPIVHELDAEVRARKLAAVRTYRTQLAGLAELAGRPLADRETLGYEVVWKLPAPLGTRALTHTIA
jgi:LmbE family N-acetylglucosaminyl deacetylase